jgi:hypothetical protein
VLLWLDAHTAFSKGDADARRETLRGALGASAGEALHANTFPLKPDGQFTVVAIYTGVTDDGFVRFAPAVVTAFNAAAEDLVSRFTTDERARLESLIREFREVASPYGASDEAIGIAVPGRMIDEAKRRMGEVLDGIDEPLLVG